MQLDELDAGLLRLLQQDARLSFRQLAAKLDTTTPTVSARVKAMEDLGIIRGYRADIDPAILGGTMHVVSVRAAPSALGRVAKQLADITGVEEVVLLSGGTLQARVRTRPPEQKLRDVHEAIAVIQDVQGYDVAEVLGTGRRAVTPEVSSELDVACHQCHGPIHGEPVMKTLGGHAHVFCCRHCLGTFVKRFEAHSK
ncbi:MAG: winged helix-turn-helix transcriptional regulator [Candidatus Thermoplasmatota archaeon]